MLLKTIAPWADLVLDRPPMTSDELALLPEDILWYELVEGRLVRMSPPGGEHGVVDWRLGAPLGTYVDQHSLGYVLGAETGFTIESHPDTVLAPDLAFVRTERAPNPDSAEWRGFWRIAPDLVVEIVSPTRSRAGLAEKARRWLRAGTRLVWVVLPALRQVDVWRGDEHVTLTVDDTLDGLDVVPGFTLPVAALFVSRRDASTVSR